MKFGDIILIPFPFAEIHHVKVRPAVVITETHDKYRDLVISAISSQIPLSLSDREIFLKHSELNNLKVDSIIKADRIVTVKLEDVIKVLGRLSGQESAEFKVILTEMIG